MQYSGDGGWLPTHESAGGDWYGPGQYAWEWEAEPLSDLPLQTPRQRARRFLEDVFSAKWDPHDVGNKGWEFGMRQARKRLGRAWLVLNSRVGGREDMESDLAQVFSAFLGRKKPGGRANIANLELLNEQLLDCDIDWETWMKALEPKGYFGKGRVPWDRLYKRLGLKE